MMKVLQRTLKVSIATMLILISGCTSTLHPRHKARMTEVGVVSVSFAPKILSYTPPTERWMGTRLGAGHYAWTFAKYPLLMSAGPWAFYCFTDQCLAASAGFMGVAAVGGGAGALFGGLAGAVHAPVAPEEALTFRSGVEGALAAVDFQLLLRQSFMEAAASPGRHNFIDLGAHGAALPRQERTDYRSLEGVPSVIELAVHEIGLEGNPLDRSTIRFRLAVKARLFVSLRKALLTKDFTFTSIERPFLEWAADDGALVCAAMEEGYRQVGRAIMQEWFY